MRNRSCNHIALIGAVAIFAAATTVNAQTRVRFDLPRQTLEESLRAVGKTTSINILIDRKVVAGLQAPALQAELDADQAIARLLEGTGLKHEFVNENTVVLVPADAAIKEPAPAPAEATSEMRWELEEVVVTAQKRVERLQDVPVPVTALDAGSLQDSNRLRLQDFFSRVPGLNFQAGSRAEPLISIRGINSLQNPTVGFMLDDVPFGSTVFRGGGAIAPDIDPADLARIEVLRGPQGTLYGVSSLGGLVKYVTIDPSTEDVSGHVRTGINSVRGGDDVGYDISGSVNVPLNDTLAVRASAFTRSTPGYIDNLVPGSADVNETEASGGRLAALWKLSETFSLKLSALYQQKDIDGADLAAPALGDLVQRYPNNRGWIERTYEAYSATLTGKLGDAEITSLTGYGINEFHSSADVPAFSGLANANFGVTAATQDDHFRASKFTQEVRLLTPLGERFEWLLGGFYTRERFTNPIEVPALDPITGATAGLLATFDGRGGYEEYAAFTDLTVQLTERFDVQAGARWSHNSQYYSEIDTGVPQLIANGRLVIPESEVTGTPVTYLLTPRLKVSQDLMVYARFASGYRAGGINLFFARGFPVPPGYDSDETYNYELGAKGHLFDRALSFDASVFYIDWKDLQLGFSFAPGVNFQDNGSRAKSQGVELALEARPFTGTTIALTASYNDAVLTEDFGASTTRGRSGDRLPFSSELAGSLSIEQSFLLAAGWSARLSGSITYVGDRVGLFRPNSAPLRQEYPSYTQLDLLAGVENDIWRASLFVNNLADKRGLLGGGLGQTNPNLFTYIQPRTIGISASRMF